MRDGYILYIYDSRASRVLVTHNVTWSRKDSFCKGQFADDQPEEKPSVPVKICISQKKEKKTYDDYYITGYDQVMDGTYEEL